MMAARSGSKERRMKSQVIKRTINLAGRNTSISLEDAFWNGLKEIAANRGASVSDLVDSIKRQRQQKNLSSAVRLFVLRYYLDQLKSAEQRSPTSRQSRSRRPVQARSRR
jgi:predicted DNA-binding ribbon-helix-helix protein